VIVDVCLILLLDSSSAVTAGQWQLQSAATSAAIRHPDVVGNLTAGPSGRSAVIAAEWSNAFAVMTPWTVIEGQADADRAAGAMDKHQRYGHGTADLRHALKSAKDMMLAAKTLGIECESTVVDVSGGGDSAVSGDAYEEIAALTQEGAQINAIVVGGELAVRDFYRDTVPGFVAWATWDVYAQAIRAKIMVEIGKFADVREEYRTWPVLYTGLTRWGLAEPTILAGLAEQRDGNPVPEPSLALVGLLGLGYLGWRAR
jgi:hypothetical protein